MNFQGLKVVGIEIVIIILVKCITAGPALSRVQMNNEEEPETSTNHPSVPAWVQANGHGKHKRTGCVPLHNRQIIFFSFRFVGGLSVTKSVVGWVNPRGLYLIKT